MIRGLDQVSLRVTISEIRREILKQLGVSYSGVGSNTTAVNGVTYGSGVPGSRSPIPLRSTGRLAIPPPSAGAWPARRLPRR